MAIRHVVTRGYGSAATSGSLLLEGGGLLLLESGGELLLETEGAGFAGAISEIVTRGYTPGEPVVAPDEAEAPSGGFWLAYELEYTKRRRLKRKREELESLAERAQDEVEREIARELRKSEAEQARIDELERLAKLVERHQQSIIDDAPKRIALVAERAIIQRNFSAMEALERELKRMREEELFMLEAIRLITNGGPLDG